MSAARVLRRRTSSKDWSFLEFVAVLFVIGIVLELLFVSLSNAGGLGWLWVLPGLTALIGIVWLVAREPANL
ncbi:MAG TPA: hypothetical protein VEO20_10685 [Thermoplasmata archaeon]|nr:hypothetical protein [Thermoplasmata archaeon]